jgi:hypothetical protein
MPNELAKSDEAAEKPICFTIMPFGGRFDEYYERLYRPAIHDAGLKPCRADDLNRPSAIINDIWAYTNAAKVILAELTGKNPNVFYELGLAHAIARPAVLVTATMDDVPFDLRALRIVEYDRDAPDWGSILRTRITAALKEVLAAPLKSVLPTFLHLSPKQEDITISRQDVLEMKQDIDSLKRQLRTLLPQSSEDDAVLDYVRRTTIFDAGGAQARKRLSDSVKRRQARDSGQFGFAEPPDLGTVPSLGDPVAAKPTPNK